MGIVWLFLFCLVVFIILLRITNIYESAVALVSIGLSCAAWIVLALIIVTSLISYPQKINEFNLQKEYIEKANNTNGEDYALTTKKIELNKWLYNEQFWLNERAFWTLAPKEILELTPIE